MARSAVGIMDGDGKGKGDGLNGLRGDKMRDWWDANGGMLIHGESPLTLAIDNSARECYQMELRREFLTVFSEDLVHMDGTLLLKFKDGAYLNELRKMALKTRNS